jgi:hypothetical protein
MTLSDMAVVDGSPMAGGAQPVGVNARARVKPSVTARNRKRTRQAPSVGRFFRVVYLDATDSWIAHERSPSAKTVWATDHTAHLDTVWKPYRVWATGYRAPAVFFALLLDAIKFLLIHPLRGPITLTVAAALYLTITG